MAILLSAQKAEEVGKPGAFPCSPCEKACGSIPKQGWQMAQELKPLGGGGTIVIRGGLAASVSLPGWLLYFVLLGLFGLDGTVGAGFP